MDTHKLLLIFFIICLMEMAGLIIYNGSLLPEWIPEAYRFFIIMLIFMVIPSFLGILIIKNSRGGGSMRRMRR